MELFYTGATKEGNSQPDPIKSLGNFVSSSKIPNGSLDNLFTGGSYYSIFNNPDNFEVIAIVLKNTTGEDKTDVSFWFEKPVDSFYQYEIAFVNLNQDNLCGYYMEKISNRNSLPYIGTFVLAEGEINKANIGNLTSNSMVGIWIKRSIIQSQVSDIMNCDALYEEYLSGVSPSNLEEVSFKIEFS